MGLDAGPEIGIADRRGHHQVHWPTQQFAKLPPQVKIGFENIDVRVRLKLNQEIHVATCRVKIVVPGGTEHLQAAYMEAPTQGLNLLAVGFEHW
jgi:hypothetical protein